MTTIEQDIKLRKIQFKVEEMAKEIVSMMNDLGIELSETENLWCNITTCIASETHKSITIHSYVYDTSNPINKMGDLFSRYMLVEEAQNESL